MKNKREEGSQPLHHETTVFDGEKEDHSSNRHSCLTGILGFEKETRLRQARAMASEVFLQTCLLPLIERERKIDESSLAELLVEFKQARGDLDTDFEIAQVVARMLSRFQNYLFDEAEDSIPVLSDSLERELNFFMALADLDFKRIDEAVRERLHTG